MSASRGSERFVFYHTHIATYVVASCAIVAASYDSMQGFVQRFHLSKKWLVLFGATCFFAYIYARPLIRRGLGSAERGYINFYTLYIVWLVSAVFYHLPSLDSLGIDIKADVSLLLMVFLVSLLTLGLLHALHGLAVALKLLQPCLQQAGSKEVLSMLLLNSSCLAVACSTYYGFCGNAAVNEPDSPLQPLLKAAICQSWLHPVPTSAHPTFTWVLYSEPVAAANAFASGNDTRLADGGSGSEGDGVESASAPSASISPVFTLWLTFVAMFAANCVADYSAALTLHTDNISALRPADLNLQLGSKVGRLAPRKAAAGGLPRRLAASCAALEFAGRRATGLPGGAELPCELQPQGRFGSPPYGLQPALLLSSTSVESLLNGVTKLRRKWSELLPGSARRRSCSDALSPSGSATLSRSSSWGSIDSFKADADAKDAASRRLWTNEGDKEQAAAPDFLPMFPWYSGTSADLLKTALDLLVSVKLFLGRFDMRTMQASLAGSMDTNSARGPVNGDGFLFAHKAEEGELWFDFTADTGDGGDSTYAVAAAMAQPALTVTLPAALLGGKAGSEEQAAAAITRELPRGALLVHGGDLAYPNPCKDTYETRLFKPYEAAFPPPPFRHPAHIVVNKPDLELDRHPAPPSKSPWGASAGSEQAARGCTCRCPPVPQACGVHARAAPAVAAAAEQGCRMCAKAEALRRYDGPSAFVIPGNHDWFDGLETFQRHILHKGWLGGWLLPQEASYFALRLPAGWWLFGIDLALVEDIDVHQFRYFASIADSCMGPDDQVLLVTHQPRWLLDWYWGEHLSPNLRQLVRGRLRGRCRLHVAGDLHFYMRHSFVVQPPSPADEPAAAQRPPCSAASGSPRGGSPRGGSPRGGSPPRGCSPLRGCSPPPRSFSDSVDAAALNDATNHLQAGAARRSAAVDGRGGAVPAGPGGAAPDTASPLHGTSSSSSSDSCDDAGFGWQSVPERCSGEAAGAAAQRAAERDTTASAAAGWRLNDPEHLVVCGLGGGFLHPTHVFKPSCMEPRHAPAAGPEYIARSTAGTSASLASPTGEYRCASAYPSPAKSYRLGRDNLGLFRVHNTRFDVIGGLLYYCLVVSVLPRCGSMAAVLNASTLVGAATQFGAAACEAVGAVFAESTLSLLVLTGLFVAMYGFARGGGVGSLSSQGAPPAGQLARGRDGEQLHPSQVAKARMGGAGQQLLFAFVHAGGHLLTAVVLVLLLELGIETCIRYEGVGGEGYHSLYRWYSAFEEDHFPDPRGLRATLERWSLHLYPKCIKWLMALFDVPEAIAVSRASLCSGVPLTRLQAAAYYLGVLAYYWLLATPAMGFLFGAYLYLCVNWAHVHYDEAFSALRIPNYKGFLRFHITPQGDLEMFALAQDRVPCAWAEDPRWRGPKGAGSARAPAAHHAKYPSRWIPAGTGPHGGYHPGHDDDDSCSLKVVDYLFIPHKRQV